ncbi:MAG: efflux RND transporter periplasmic adaptor subunit [Bacteroidaceae bacterium]|nr:efflux RND transporter periplasmic adaptor subunit [Bacteroidaceae bacterium]
MKMNLKYITVLGTVVASILSSCSNNSQRQMPSANFETMKVATKDVTMNTKYSATIRGRQDIDIMPQVSGTLTKLCVTEGQVVKAGQPLFIIDQVPYQAALNTALAALESAKAQLATSQLEYDSKKQLFEQHVVSEFDIQKANNALQTAKAVLAQSQAQVVNARNNLSYTVVKSPSNGIVGTLPYRQGALVSPSMGQPLTTVSDNNQMYVYFSINEAQLLSMTRESGSAEAAISAMPEIKLLLVDGSEYKHTGKVESVSGVVDRTTGTVQVRAVFDNPEKLLHSGSTGYVVIPTIYKDKIVIPATATVQIQDKFKVYLVDKNNIAHEQLVVTEPHTNGKEYVIKEGLKAGDIIVAEGAGMLKDGQNVKPNKENQE